MTAVGVMGVPELVILVFGAALFGALAATLARHRGRSVGPWAVLGCIFGPVALLVMVLLPVQKGRADSGRRVA